MLIDTSNLPDGDVLEADVCVVGAGAAGISFALQFAGGPVDVVLLEGGGVPEDGGGRGIYQVVYAPTAGLAVERQLTWCFGGNTNHWLGHCRPLDESDFTPRDWIPYSGWPIGRRELVSFYERAQTLCGLGDFRYYDADACRPHLSRPPVAVDPAKLSGRIVQTCPIASYDRMYRDRLRDARNIRVCLHAEAVCLRANESGDRVRTIEASAGGGRRIRIAARAFVLAAGGIENPRLLLCSNDVQPAGLGNDHDVVGRFFMEHPYVDIALGPSRRGGELFAERDERVEGTAVWRQWVLSDESMRAERLAGLGLWVLPRAAREVLSRARIGNLWRARAGLDDLLGEAASMSADAASVARYAWQRVARRPHAPRGAGYALRVELEQCPDPGNRVRLSSRRDEIGRPEAELAFRITEADRRVYVRALAIAAQALGWNGPRIAKRMELMLRAGRVGFFWHHMGATRMHPDPKQGVVDADCRVHGVSNLFVAGSSVFPTGGTAAPTLTIVALALRLADHIRARCL